jgi:hypothetical protein
MRPRKTEHDRLTLDAFNQQKVLTIAALCTLLQLSIATVRRRLKDWEVLSSYNKSGQYYTLPSIPQFNKHGLWSYQGALFSRHGTLKNTVVHLVRLSAGGLSNAELEQILGINPNSYLPQLKQLAGVRKEKHKRQVVYFSSHDEQYRRQQANRFPPEPAALKLPPDAIAIIVLVRLIKHPSNTPAELSQMLGREGYDIEPGIIENLFEHYGLKKKRNISE